MKDISDLLRDIASDASVEPFDESKAPKKFEASLFKPVENNDVFSPGDRVIWFATNNKNEILAEHKAEIIRVTATKIYIKTDGGFFRYVSRNRLKKVEKTKKAGE